MKSYLNKKWKTLAVHNSDQFFFVVTEDFVNDDLSNGLETDFVISNPVPEVIANHIVDTHNKSLDFPLVKESKYENHDHNTADEVYMSLDKHDIHMIREALRLNIFNYQDQCKRNAEMKEEMLTWTDEYHYEKMTGGDTARLRRSERALEKLEAASELRNKHNTRAIHMKYGIHSKDGKGGHIKMSAEEVTAKYKKEEEK